MDGLQNGFANLSGVVAPALTGFLVDRTGKFLAPLAIAAAVLAAGGLAWVFAVGPVEQVSWESESGEAPAATARPQKDKFVASSESGVVAFDTTT
jgi:hypothetical protein